MNDLDNLEEKIRQARHVPEQSANNIQTPGEDDGGRMGIQAGLEFVASIAVGTAIGYGLDSWLGTKPAFVLIMFFFGVCTGFYNVYRVTQNMGSAVGFSQLHNAEKDAKTAPELPNTDEDEED